MRPTVQRTNRVRDIVKCYFNAWTSGDFEAARYFLADRLDFQRSIDRFDNADDFFEALRAFRRMLKYACLLKEFYGPGGAMLLYDCVTDSPAGTIRTAESFRVREGKIFQILLVFDATRLRQLMGR